MQGETLCRVTTPNNEEIMEVLNAVVDRLNEVKDEPEEVQMPIALLDELNGTRTTFAQLVETVNSIISYLQEQEERDGR